MTSNTDFVPTASMFQYLLMGELVMFSICLLMIQIKTRTVYIFLVANAVALFGNLFLLQAFEARDGFTSPLGEALLIFSSLCADTTKYLFFSKFNLFKISEFFIDSL